MMFTCCKLDIIFAWNENEKNWSKTCLKHTQKEQELKLQKRNRMMKVRAVFYHIRCPLLQFIILCNSTSFKDCAEQFLSKISQGYCTHITCWAKMCHSDIDATTYNVIYVCNGASNSNVQEYYNEYAYNYIIYFV